MICSKKTNLCFCSRFNLQLFFIYASLSIFDQWFQIFSFCSGPLKPWYTHFKKTIFFPLHILGLLKKAGCNYQTNQVCVCFRGFCCCFSINVNYKVKSRQNSSSYDVSEPLTCNTLFNIFWKQSYKKLSQKDKIRLKFLDGAESQLRLDCKHDLKWRNELVKSVLRLNLSYRIGSSHHINVIYFDFTTYSLNQNSYFEEICEQIRPSFCVNFDNFLTSYYVNTSKSFLT